MKSEPINGYLVRRRRQMLGAQGSLRAFARKTGLTGPSLRTIETTDRIPGETPLHQLTRIAKVLGIPVTDLLQRPDPSTGPHVDDAYEPGDSDTLAADISRLGQLLLQDSRHTRKVPIAVIFKWDRARLRAAQTGLDQQLRPAGIRVHELNGSLALRPVDSRGDDDADRIAAYRVASDGMSLRQAEILYGILTENMPTHQLQEDRLPFLSSLMNLGIVYHEMNGGRNSHRLTPAAAYAFDV